MSLHAHLSREAEEQLRAQKRNSTISSIVLSILVIFLVGLVLFYISLKAFRTESPTIVAYSAGSEDETELQEKKIMNQVRRQTSAPSSAMAKVIASSTPSPTAIPVPEVDVPTPSTDYGSGDDFGAGWGSGGDGGGGGFGSIPATMRKRCSAQDRLARLAENGGSKECEDAVLKALRWLKKTQNKDGSWTNKNQAAMTGFALLAYLGHCETPLSEEFGGEVTNAIVYLVDLGMKNNGRLTVNDPTSHAWVYEHGICTYALAEATTFCKQLNINIPNLEEVTKKAGTIIIKGQGQSGGWVYSYKPTNGGDNSVGFWQIQALKACKHTGLWTDRELTKPAKKALEWLEKAQGSNGAIGYRGDSKKNPGLTGGGVLCFQMWGEGFSRPARKGVDWIDANVDFKWKGQSSNLYYHYYHAQAMINHGGEKWKKYNSLFRDELLKAQSKEGTWHNAASRHSNLHMSTCLATLMLEVYYRFLPGTGGKMR